MAEAERDESLKTVRFTAVVAVAGKPELYLPLFDPKQDPAFMRAVKEERVLSIRQDPTSKQSDFGVVGFDEKKYTTLLIFPKPLTAFADSRVIGIKYDMVGESHVVPSAVPRSLKLPKPRVEKPRPASLPRESPPPKPPEPPKRVEPQPKEFRVRVRITTVKEKEVTVKAMTKAEAKEKARAAVQGEGDVRAVSADEV